MCSRKKRNCLAVLGDLMYAESFCSCSLTLLLYDLFLLPCIHVRRTKGQREVKEGEHFFSKKKRNFQQPVQTTV